MATTSQTTAATLAGTGSGDSGPPASSADVVTKVAAEIDVSAPDVTMSTPSTAALSPDSTASAGPAIPGIADSGTFSAGAASDASVVLDAAATQNVTAVTLAATGAADAGAASALTLHVSPSGNDTWSGSLQTANASRTDGPLRTLAAAQTAVRTRLAQMTSGAATRQPVSVLIGAGTYMLTAPLTFTPADSGVTGSPVVWQAQVPGTVNLNGGIALGTVTATAAGQTITLPAPAIDAANQRGGTQLYVNGVRATLARSPNAGSYWFVERAVPLADEPSDKLGQEAFAPPAAALSLLNGLSASDRSRAIVNIMQAWTSGAHRLSTLTAPAGAVRVTPRASWAFLSFGTNQRFFVENVAAAFDAPGEWLWNGNTVQYKVRPNEVGMPLSFAMPLADRLLVVRGDTATGTPVHDLEFRGLNFVYARRLTPDAGYVDSQASTLAGAAIEVDLASRIVIDGCAVRRTGGYAIWLRSKVRDSRITRCTMSDLGAGGVKVGLTAQAPTEVGGTGANTVSSNVITETGKVLPSGVGIWIGQSFDNVVSHNLVGNTTYTGISVGWAWNYGTATSGRNSVLNNLLVNIGMGTLGDVGGVYTVGESPGTVVSGNVMHQVRPYSGYGAGAWGLYNDEATTGMTMEKNIVVGTDGGGYALHYGRNNTIRNNVLAFGDRGEVQVSKTDPNNTNLSFQNNVLIPKVTAPFMFFATAPDVLYSLNKVSGSVLSTPVDLTKCNGGCSTSTATLSVAADPRAVALTGVDAATTAWVATVTANVGPIGLPVAQIPKVVATLPTPVVAPPIGYQFDLNSAVVGTAPLGLKYVFGASASSMAVISSTGTASGKCLRFNDGPGNGYRYEPYAFATLNHDSGTTTAEFTIKIDAATNFFHEWRDDARPYLAGPSLRIKPAGVEVNGAIVAPVTVGQWIRIKIAAGLGTTAGTWRLEVTDGSAATRVISNLPNRDTAWKRLTWLGFVSDSAVTSSACIGSITAVNQ